MDLEAFKEATIPAHRRSKLDPHAATISALLLDGYSYAQVVNWLAGKGVVITKQSIGEWVQRRKRHGPLGASAKQRTAPQSPTEPHEQQLEPAAPPPSSSPTALDSIIGKPVNLDAYARKRRKPNDK